MARVGINPARGKLSGYRPARVTVVVLTYIPNLAGYFEQRLQILKLVLASLQAHTSQPYDLLVFDNGSCSPVTSYLNQLKEESQINYLILSGRNIGKIDAFRILFNAAPGEVIAYNDDDILFYPRWLEAHLEILDYFPKAGMVSGAPVRNATNHARQSLEALATHPLPGLSVTSERRIPDAWEVDWALSTGRDPQKHLEATRDLQDMVFRVEKPGGQGIFETIGSANHFQFVAPKSILLQALPDQWTGRLMGSMVELDEAVDNLGYLRLSTIERYTRHLGNTLSDEVMLEAQQLGLISSTNSEASMANDGKAGTSTDHSAQRKPREKHPLLRIPGSRRILSAVYNRLFDILYR